MRDGHAAFRDGSAVSSGEKADFQTSGVVQLPKTNGIKILDGGRVYWDHSANACHYKPVNDRDFFIGCAVGDWESGDTSMQVNLNREPRYLLDIARDPWVDVVVGTQALGGLGPARRRGGAHNIAITATNEAQKVDMLSRDGFAKGANAIIEAIINVISDGAGAAVDVSVGAADDTHATDADSIVNSIFVHLNANDVNIYLESDDGITEVAATDSTIDYTEGTPFEVWFDMRDPADVQIYINGALVLGSTVFNVDGSGPTWKLLVHVEKTAATDTYSIEINRLCARIAEQ